MFKKNKLEQRESVFFCVGPDGHIIAALDCLVCLVERDCDITLGDSNANLPIHYAASSNHLDTVRFLARQGSSMLATQGEGKTIIHVVSPN